MNDVVRQFEAGDSRCTVCGRPATVLVQIRVPKILRWFGVSRAPRPMCDEDGYFVIHGHNQPRQRPDVP